MPRKSTSTWLPRVLFESALITVSILLALGLDEWREDRQDQETVEQAMSNFLSEVRRNKARIDDAAPFNTGLRYVLVQRHQEGGIQSIAEFISMVESYAPVVLQSTAWETALATGSVAKMDYDLVSALSLTYGLQNRYQQISRTGLLDQPGLSELSGETLELFIYNSIRHLTEVTNLEAELGVVYEEADAIIRDAYADMRQATPEEVETWSRAAQ